MYATCVGNAVKWFPDRRGLASVGLTAAGFGAGAAVTVIPIRILIASHGTKRSRSCTNSSFDKVMMRQHMRKIAKAVLGKAKAKEVEENDAWFS